MSQLVSSQIQYHATFLLRRHREAEGDWRALLGTVRDWIYGRLPPRECHFGDWFFSNGEWKSTAIPGTIVECACADSDIETGQWRSWAVRFEHVDPAAPGRIWRTDVGIQILGSTEFGIAITNSHFLRPGYFGETPLPPQPSAPKLVARLLTSRFWDASAGSEPLKTTPTEVLPGDAPSLRDRLLAPDRECPLILISRLPDGALPIQPEHLARLVAGAATVYVFVDRTVDTELDWFLRQGFRCYGGSIRVYQPRVRLDIPGDARRHRFLRPGALPAADLEFTIVRGVCQLPASTSFRYPRTIEDVQARERELRLDVLRATADDDSKELFRLFEEENAALTNTNRDLEKRHNILLEKNDAIEDALSLARNEADRLRWEKGQIISQRSETAVPSANPLAELENLPDSLVDLIDMATSAFPGQLLFADRARKSASDSSFQNLRIAWRIVRAMATELRDLPFTTKLSLLEISKRFQDKTGFELGVGESETTRNNARLAAKRRLIYNGGEVSIESHVKYGVSSPRCLRVYYYPDADRRILVIGHFGDHLDTVRSN